MVNRVWIIGGGRFGERAAEALGRPGKADVLVVEKNPRRCRDLSARGIHNVCDDGVRFLAERLDRPERNLWIVAAAPLHVAFEWATLRLSRTVKVVRLCVPESIVQRLPNPMKGRGGDVYASNADFICPADCSEAGRVCTATGRRRPCNLHAYIAGLGGASVKTLVVRSFQLGAGVGGLRALHLWRCLDEIRAFSGPMLLATACRCHAVLTCFRISEG